jgi:NAD+ synthase (glutamine-hydrolysing)
MRCIHLGAASLNQTPLDWSGNRRRITAALDAARAAGVVILCLPEMCISGYGCEDAFLGMGTCQQALHSLAQLLPHTRGIATCLGLPLFWRGAIYNTVAWCVDGGLYALIAKRHLAGDGVHYEPRWFRPWPAGERVAFTDGALACPLGDLHLDHGGLRIAFEICEDAWAAQRPAAQQAVHAIDLVLNPSASHFAFGKQAVRERIVIEGSRACCATYCYANLLGNEAGRMIFDGDCLIASAGRLVAVGERLGLTDHQLVTAVVDVDQTRQAQARTASFRTRVADDAACVAIDAQVPQVEPEEPRLVRAAWDHPHPHLPYEEFTRAVALGLVDHLRKSRSRGFVVSLSGGADSAAVACLVRIAWDLGVATWGEPGWQQRLGLEEGTGCTRFLTCVYQATANSSVTTRDAAQGLAASLGASFHAIDVQPLVDGYRSLAEGMLGRSLDWRQDDIALQNIQARVRAPGVWMLTNCLGALLLATSNRSEAAVGYATMDGDTCGGLSPIAGIDKAFLRRWLTWLESDGPTGLAPIPALAAINRQEPTAELRPPAARQTDEDDLMPYPVLDAIERLAIRDRLPPSDCLRRLRVCFPDHPLATLRLWTRRFFTLWSRNQWKRERYAPGFHLDDENLDPKTWCRFPILSGGFADELAAMEDGAVQDDPGLAAP